LDCTRGTVSYDEISLSHNTSCAVRLNSYVGTSTGTNEWRINNRHTDFVIQKWNSNDNIWEDIFTFNANKQIVLSGNLFIASLNKEILLSDLCNIIGTTSNTQTQIK
jgi:hypothetical protein